MFIRLNPFSSPLVSCFKEFALRSLTQQKKILAIAAVTMSGLTICCLVIGHLRNRRIQEIKSEVRDQEKERSERNGGIDFANLPQELLLPKIKSEVRDQEKEGSERNGGIDFATLPQELLLPIFLLLNGRDMTYLSQCDSYLHKFSQDPAIIASLLEKAFLSKKNIPLSEKLKLAKQAGGFLTKFNLEDSNITDQELQELFQVCPNIQEINLNHCLKITDVGLAHLPQGLQSLNLTHCRQITDAGLVTLPQGLQSLNLFWCKQITDAGIAHLPQRLQSLNLCGCYITDAVLAFLPQGLQSLDLSWCKRITDAGLATLPQGLQSLNLSDCRQITDAGIAHLPQGLQSLNLYGCYINITDAGIAHLPQGLQSLDLRGCDQITNKGLTKLSTKLLIVHELTRTH